MRSRIMLVSMAIVLLAAIGLVVASCGGATTTTTAGGAATTATTAGVTTTAGGASTTAGGTATTGATGGNQVTIENFSFNPASITVKTGDTVTWTNKDSTTHTVTADKGEFSSGDVASGSTFSFTFKTAGTVTYHCSIHPTMKGTVVVQ